MLFTGETNRNKKLQEVLAEQKNPCNVSDGTIGSSTTTGNYLYYHQQYSEVCPSCGYCRHCGRRNGGSTYPNYPNTTITWGGNTSTSNSTLPDKG